METGGGECPCFDTHKEGAASGVSPCLDENRQNNPPRRVEVEGEGEGERELSLGGLFCLFSSLYKGCARSGTLLVCIEHGWVYTAFQDIVDFCSRSNLI